MVADPRKIKPRSGFFGTELMPWDSAAVHPWSEAVVRGLNVFEGLRVYRQPDGSLGVVAAAAHLERLARSARILAFPPPPSNREIADAIRLTVEDNVDPRWGVYARPTLMVVGDRMAAEDLSSKLFVAAFPEDHSEPAPLRIGVSAWRRAHDLALPPRVKSGVNYHAGRLARLEGAQHGQGEMLLLNEAGRVAELTGACVLISRGGTLATPPPSEGALESITVDAVERLCAAEGIPFERRPVEFTELLVADGVAACGTAAELTPIVGIGAHEVASGDSALDAVRAAYRDAVTGVALRPEVVVTPVHELPLLFG